MVLEDSDVEMIVAELEVTVSRVMLFIRSVPIVCRGLMHMKLARQQCINE